jgi:hypothetical protein
MVRKHKKEITMKYPYVMRIAKVLISLGSGVLLVACGGDSASTPNFQRAQFIDDPVGGLSYSCTGAAQNTSGTTDSDGYFNYLPGQTCTFSVGKVTLGTVSSIPTDGKVTPQDVAGVARSATAAPSAVAIAQFLQSLSDPGTPNRIVISAATREALNANAVTAVSLASSEGAVSPTVLRTLVETVAGKTLVAENVASAALDAQISQGNVSTSAGTVSASTPKVLNSILVTSNAASKPAGLELELTATGYYSDGSTNNLTGVVTWTSADTNKLTVSSAGLARALRVGTANVSASYRPEGASTTVTGNFVQTIAAPQLQAIAITHTATPPEGLDDQLTATGTYSDGSTADLSTQVVWASSDSSKVTVNSSGKATGVAKGSATITASYTPSGGTAVVGTFSETVSDPTVLNLAIYYVQDGLSSIQNGATAALKAVLTWSNTVTQTVSSLVDWVVAAVSGGSGAATVAKANKGTDDATLTATAVGDVSIVAHYLDLVSNSLGLTINPVISGVAASGAPMENADVTITCADGSVKTGTSNSVGYFSIDLGAGCPAPYVLVASVSVGDAKQTLVSVQPTAVQGSATVNITPLTHAISATLASNGDPLTLASAIASEKDNITPAAVTERNNALVTSLASAMQAAGVSGTPNLISSTFDANRSGIDKLLDNLKVVVGPSGVNITNTAASKVDDMANVGNASVASDLSASSITISKATNFSAALPALPAALDDASVVDAVQRALNDCFALPAANRINLTTGVTLGKCADLTRDFVDADNYKHDGKNLAQEFTRWMTGTLFDDAKFLKPEIVRFFSNSETDARALVRFGLQRTDGVGEWFTTVAEKSTRTGNSWKLRGNQRDYKVFVNAYVVREEQLVSRTVAANSPNNRPAGAYYHSGLNLYFGINSANTVSQVKYVKVTGPGLPDAGVYLRYMSGCDSYYVIASGPSATPTTCTSTYRMQYRKAGSADPENNATQSGFTDASTEPYYARPAKTDTQVQAIAPFSAYRYEIVYYDVSKPSTVYVERLRSRPLALGTNDSIGSSEVDKLVFNTGMAQETKDLINPVSAAAFNGTGSFRVSWRNVAGAPPVNSIQVQSKTTANGQLYQDETNVPVMVPGLSSAALRSATLSNSPTGWGNMSSVGAAGTYNLAQLRARDMNDLQYFHNWRY